MLGRSRGSKSWRTRARPPPREFLCRFQGSDRRHGLAARTAACCSVDSETHVRQTAHRFRSEESLLVYDDETHQRRNAVPIAALDSPGTASRWRYPRLLQLADGILGILPRSYRLHHSDSIRFCALYQPLPRRRCRGTSHGLAAFTADANRRVSWWIAGDRSASFSV